MKDVMKIFKRQRDKDSLFEKIFAKRFGVVGSYPLHPPHAVDKQGILDLGSNHFYSSKKDGVNAFLMTSPEGTWLKFRNGTLLYALKKTSSNFADIEICEEVVYVLDAVKNNDVDMAKPFLRRYMMRDSVRKILNTLNIPARNQSYYSRRKLDDLMAEAPEGIIAVPFSAPFPTATHTSVLKYKFVETIDLEVVSVCRAAQYTEERFSCCMCLAGKECTSVNQVAMCRTNGSEGRAVVAVSVSPGDAGIYEGIVRRGHFKKMRPRKDKTHPNRWHTVQQIAKRSGWSLVQSDYCIMGKSAHKYEMISETNGMCMTCMESMSFLNGVPMTTECDKQSWLVKVRKKNPPKVVMEIFERKSVKRPWKLADDVICGAISTNKLASQTWLLAHPLPRRT